MEWSTFIGNRDKPYAIMELMSSKGKKLRITCLIDTGFDGGLAVSKVFQKVLSYKVEGEQVYELADGSHDIWEIYSGKVRDVQGKSEVEIPVVFIKGKENLVGIEFLRDKLLVFDLKERLISLR